MSEKYALYILPVDENQQPLFNQKRKLDNATGLVLDDEQQKP